MNAIGILSAEEIKALPTPRLQAYATSIRKHKYRRGGVPVNPQRGIDKAVWQRLKDETDEELRRRDDVRKPGAVRD